MIHHQHWVLENRISTYESLQAGPAQVHACLLNRWVDHTPTYPPTLSTILHGAPWRFVLNTTRWPYRGPNQQSNQTIFNPSCLLQRRVFGGSARRKSYFTTNVPLGPATPRLLLHNCQYR